FFYNWTAESRLYTRASCNELRGIQLMFNIKEAKKDFFQNILSFFHLLVPDYKVQIKIVPKISTININKVIFYLDPLTFDEFEIVKDSKDKFELNLLAWKSFDLKVKVVLESGEYFFLLESIILKKVLYVRENN
ncbi:MAG TPA: pYEATS domain-containing protein, partial [Candidatus Paceibacterota bacterium]|nr:pYEATS domain-containing protein [Candidatus Paceibacterota bacterium]